MCAILNKQLFLRKACLLLTTPICNQSMAIYRITIPQQITFTHMYDHVRLILIINIFFYPHIYEHIKLLFNIRKNLFNSLFIVSLKLLRHLIYL